MCHIGRMIRPVNQVTGDAIPSQPWLGRFDRLHPMLWLRQFSGFSRIQVEQHVRNVLGRDKAKRDVSLGE